MQNILGNLNKPNKPVSAKKKSNERHQVETDENTDKWPPKKFANVRSSGYGTSWSPKPVRRTPSTQINSSNTQIISNRVNSSRRPNENKTTRSSRSKTKIDFLNQSDKTNTLQSTGRNDELIANLQSELTVFV